MKLHFPNESFIDTFVRKLLIAYVILQPVLDIYMSLFDKHIQIAGTSLATIIRFFMVAFMAALVMLHPKKKKLTVCFSVFLGLVAVYTVIHHFNAIGFTVALAQARYSLFQELLYIARMCIPPTLIYVICCVKPTYADVKKMILGVSVIMSAVILTGSLLKYGHLAYSLEPVVVEHSMLSWFTDASVLWSDMTCRGIFQWTNQISAVMLIILPMVFYICLKEQRIYLWILTVLHIIAMLNLGTRIASICSVLAFGGLVFLFVLEKIIHKESFKGQAKTLVCFLLSAAVILIFFLNAPIMHRDQEITPPTDTVLEDYIDPATLTDQEKLLYLEETLPKTHIQSVHVYTSYPYQEDLDFWYDLVHNTPYHAYSGNRRVRTFMIDRILERDDRVSNYFWGISHTRSSSFVWPERDIQTHFDSLGIVGMLLLLGPYFVGVLIGIWYFFKKFLKNLRLSRCIYLLAAGLGIVTAYLSGHVMNEVFPFVFLALMTGLTINNAKTPLEDIV